MKRILLILLFLFVNLAGIRAQSFKAYVSHGLGKEDSAFRYYKRGLIVFDDEGRELRRTELLYDMAAFCDGFDRAAVCLPLISLERGEEMGFERGLVWICLNYDLEPVFIFPPNTQHVKIVDGVFLYKDSPGHYSTVGLIDKNGKVIFEAPYERIYFEKDVFVGVKDVTKSTDLKHLTWAVGFRKKDLGETLELLLETPDYASSIAIKFEAEETDDEIWFNELLAENPFQRGLYNVVHLRIDEALDCFKEALNNGDPIIERCAEHNIEVLESSNYLSILSKR